MRLDGCKENTPTKRRARSTERSVSTGVVIAVGGVFRSRLGTAMVITCTNWRGRQRATFASVATKDMVSDIEWCVCELFFNFLFCAETVCGMRS